MAGHSALDLNEPHQAESGGATAAPSCGRPDVESPTKRRFKELMREWREATRFCSSATEMAIHPAYQQIIGLGQEAVPLILSELGKQPDHWFWALKAITGDDPVPAADRGDLARMTSAWLKWAEQRGLR